MASSVIGGKVNVDVPVTVSEIAAPPGGANFALHVPRSAVSNYVKDGSDLVIQFDDGRVLRIRNYFAHGDNYNDLVFEADAGSKQEGVWVSDFSRAVGQGADGLADSLVSYTFVSQGSDAALLGMLGAVALGGGVALAAAGGGNDDESKDDDKGGAAAPGDNAAPNAPRIAAADPDGNGRVNASGTAEPELHSHGNLAGRHDFDDHRRSGRQVVGGIQDRAGVRCRYCYRYRRIGQCQPARRSACGHDRAGGAHNCRQRCR